MTVAALDTELAMPTLPKLAQLHFREAKGSWLSRNTFLLVGETKFGVFLCCSLCIPSKAVWAGIAIVKRLVCFKKTHSLREMSAEHAFKEGLFAPLTSLASLVSNHGLKSSLRHENWLWEGRECDNVVDVE